MFLQRLREYAEEGRKSFHPPPTLYSSRPIRYVIDLASDGELLSPTPIDTADPGNRATRRGAPRLAPSLGRANKIRPLLLADNAEYTLGVMRDGSKPERVSAMHDAYVELVDRCASATGLPAVSAVSRFLNGGCAGQLHIADDFNPGDAITFRVAGEFPTDSPEVQTFWADAAAGSENRVLQCLVCGEVKPVLDRLQKKVKGIPGGQMSGTSIISANTTVFESYGLKNSQIAPTCAACGEKFTEAVNHLLSDENSHVRFPAAKVIFWTRRETPFSWGRILNSPDEADVRAQIETLWSGGRQSDLDDNAFYGAVLSASGGRAVLRDWLDTTVGEVRVRIARWFGAQSIVGGRGEEPRHLGIYALAGATVRELRDLPPNVTRSLVRCALVGTPLPMDLLYQAVRRNRAEQRVTRPRAALIKLVLATNKGDSYPEGYMVELEMTNRNPAYLCGRLLYVLEDAQRSAIRGINATIVDRYYGTASSAPASVFSRLMRGAQPHLSKLQRDNAPAYHAIQRRMTEILEGLSEFPRTLTLEEQGLFALGYYHQRADRFRRMAGGRPDSGTTAETES